MDGGFRSERFPRNFELQTYFLMIV